MAEVKRCPECRVPEQVTRDRTWLNSGVIVQSRNMSHRVCFIETENLDPVYKGVGEIIGMPIDRFIMDLTRRGAGNYIRGITPPEVKNLVKSGALRPDIITDFLMQYCELSGYGKYEFVDSRTKGDKEDYMIIRVTDPYSILTVSGSFAGACEIFTDVSGEVDYREVAPNVIEIKAYLTEQTRQSLGRLQVKEYYHRDGDIDLERCATCGGPKALSGYEWHTDSGIITNNRIARRMALVGPYLLDPVFEELEVELGKDVTAAAVDLQRRFVKSKMYSIAEISDEEDFRAQLALRGLGNLKEIQTGAKGMRMRIDNSADYLMIIGMAQGLFEMAYGSETRVEWELSQNGDLEVDVIPHD
jgi:hypothetical protein